MAAGLLFGIMLIVPFIREGKNFLELYVVTQTSFTQPTVHKHASY